MDAFRRIFGLGPAKQPARPSFVEYTAPDGSARLRMVEDTSWQAVAARHNFAAIYGAANMPPNFGMRGVIEVPDGNGAWVPVSGTTNFVPDMDAQLGFLQSYYQTGQIGVQPIAADGSMATGQGLPEGERSPVSSSRQAASVEVPGRNAQPGQQGAQGQQGTQGLSADQQLLIDALPEVMRGLDKDRRQQYATQLLDGLLQRAMPDGSQQAASLDKPGRNAQPQQTVKGQLANAVPGASKTAPIGVGGQAPAQAAGAAVPVGAAVGAGGGGRPLTAPFDPMAQLRFY